MSKKALTAGQAYDFVVFNTVFSPHGFKISGKKKTPMLGGPPNNLHEFRMMFAKPGRYPYQCTGAGQGKPGMKGVLVVKAPSSSGGVQNAS